MEVFVALQVFFFLCFSTLTFRAPEQIYLLLSFFLDKKKIDQYFNSLTYLSLSKYLCILAVFISPPFWETERVLMKK